MRINKEGIKIIINAYDTYEKIRKFIDDVEKMDLLIIDIEEEPNRDIDFIEFAKNKKT